MRRHPPDAISCPPKKSNEIRRAHADTLCPAPPMQWAAVASKVHVRKGRSPAVGRHWL